MTASDLPNLYRSLREVARRQLDSLAAEDLEAFSEAGEARERLFALILDREGEMRGLDEARSAEIRDLIRQVLADDAKITELATRAADAAREELGRIQQGMNALHAYASEALPQSYFIDRSS